MTSAAARYIIEEMKSNQRKGKSHRREIIIKMKKIGPIESEIHQRSEIKHQAASTKNREKIKHLAAASIEMHHMKMSKWHLEINRENRPWQKKRRNIIHRWHEEKIDIYIEREEENNRRENEMSTTLTVSRNLVGEIFHRNTPKWKMWNRNEATHSLHLQRSLRNRHRNV